MSGSTFQPPITIDPTQPNPSQIAFINQNFQTLASALESNSFRVVAIGDTTSPTATMSWTGSGQWISGTGLTTIAHNLSFKPSVLAYVTTSGYSVPLPSNTNFLFLGTSFPVWEVVNVFTDSTNVYVETDGIALTSSASGSFDLGGAPIRYYLLQQPAD